MEIWIKANDVALDFCNMGVRIWGEGFGGTEWGMSRGEARPSFIGCSAGGGAGEEGEGEKKKRRVLCAGPILRINRTISSINL
jgi:hypothetical protein